MNKYAMAALVAALTSITVSAQQVHQVKIGDNLNYGITYSLPSTDIQTTVTARCTKTVAGPYAPYAEKYLGLKDVAQTDQTKCEISQISMTIVGRADSTRTYHINFSEKGALPSFYLTGENCLYGINRAPESVAEKDVPVEASAKKLTYKPSDVMTPDILKAGSKAKQAELCAEEIFNIRESRSELIKGEADNTPKDGMQLQLMLDNLTAQEEALLSLFTGTTTIQTETRSYDYIPTDPVDSDVLFRFSSEFGFTDSDDLSGAPYFISVSVLEDNRLSMDVKAKQKMEKGIAYCIPGKVHVTLSKIGATLNQCDFQMAQFGHVEQLPQGQFTDKKKPCGALFNAATGAMAVFEQQVAQ